MRIDRYASIFLWLAAGMLFMFAAATIISVSGLGVHMPALLESVDPADLDELPGFDEPGLHEISEGRYEVYMIASAEGEWAFDPSEITVPVGSEVTFIVTSKDVLHGLKVADTTINIMMIPGQIAEVTYVFDEVGDFEYYCNEYCGSLHHQMAGVIHVVED
jgi:cytochrome c oxidase subunit II